MEVIVNRKNSFKRTVTILVVSLIALFAIITVATSFKVIDEGHIGVQYRLGKIITADLKPGMHFMVPFIDSIQMVDIREQMYASSTPAYTKDTQTVEKIEFTVNYLYADPEAIIKDIGITNVETQLIIPRSNAILKNAAGQYKAEDLVQGRAALQSQVETELRESLEREGIFLTAFNIKDIDFEDAFEQAIRLKVEAEQEALRKKNETVAKEEEARQAIIAAQASADSSRLATDAAAYQQVEMAKAEAEAIRLIQEQLSMSPEYTNLQKVQQWNGEFPQFMSPDVNPFVILD